VVSKSQVRVDIEIARLASERAAALTHRDLGRGRASLAAIAGTAFFIGVLGTLWALLSVFPEEAERSTILPSVARALASSMKPAAFGIAIATFALLGHQYISNRLEFFDMEMRAVTLELANLLSLLRQRIRE
jgi:biopolymer transport protein ExbB/TolQ